MLSSKIPRLEQEIKTWSRKITELELELERARAKRASCEVEIKQIKFKKTEKNDLNARFNAFAILSAGLLALLILAGVFYEQWQGRDNNVATFNTYTQPQPIISASVHNGQQLPPHETLPITTPPSSFLETEQIEIEHAVPHAPVEGYQIEYKKDYE